tara:strand:- start:1729 stop:1914 length:186 start_codon:yes stop_codon:yes gene_type:complete
MIVLMFVVIALIFAGVVCIATEDNAKDAAGEWLRIAIGAGIFFIVTFTLAMAGVFIWAVLS